MQRFHVLARWVGRITSLLTVGCLALLAAARRVTEQGSGPTLPLLSTSLSMNVAGTFCIEPTGTFLDAIAGLPAVGALSTGAEVDLTSVLLP